MESLPPEDRALAPRSRRLVPPGLLAAAALATVVVLVAVFVAVRSGPTSTSPSPPSPTGAANGGTAPVFTIRPGLQSANAATGQPLPPLTYTTLDDDAPIPLTKYRGRPLVINFWSSTCTPCITEMPEFQKVHEQLGDRVAFLGLDVLDSIDGGRFMVDKTGVTYDIGRDPNGEILLGLGGINLPTTVLVAADGTVEAVHTGQLSSDELTRAIDRELLA